MIDRSELGKKFLEKNGWEKARHEFLQGDASSRKYERLSLDNKRALFVDSPVKTDGPIVKDGITYSEIAHLAQNVRPFVAIDYFLRNIGLNAPEIYAADLENGFLLLEDFGEAVFGSKISDGDDMDTPYQVAVDVLVALSQQTPDRDINLPDGSTHKIPDFDRDSFLIEAELLTSWFWKWLGINLPHGAIQSFKELWVAAYKTLDGIMAEGETAVLALRDFHSPNLIWCENENGISRVGLIDFQDAVYTHPAYDLVSLLQDARTDIPPEVEEEYKSLYISKRVELDTEFNTLDFDLAYGILGAQRNTKILGIFARLALRDDKPHYLAHIPRVLAYLERTLATPGLESLKAWYDTYLPEELRLDISTQLSIGRVGHNAIVLSAGLGTRMAPLSDTCPKPLIQVAGKPLLAYTLEKLSDIDVQNIVVNVHYLPEQIEDYISTHWAASNEGPAIIISDERDLLLETGGGIKKALPHLGDDPFFVMNSDSIWHEKETNNLTRLMEAWDDNKMDCLILLAPCDHSLGYSGKGDFDLAEDGRLKRREPHQDVGYVVSGIYLVHPRLFENAPCGPFSMNILWDKALREDRLFGVVLDGTWLHIGTPEAVEDAEKYIRAQQTRLS